MTDSPGVRISRQFWQQYLLFALVCLIALNAWHPLWWRLNLILFGVPAFVALVSRQTRALQYWAVYLLTFFISALLRARVDDWGPAPQSAYVIALDRLLGFGTVPAVTIQQAFYTAGAPHWWDWIGVAIYQTHYVAIPVVGLMVWRWRSHLLRPFLLGMALTIAVGVLIHWLLPTVPPWMAGMRGELPLLHRPAWDLLTGWDTSTSAALGQVVASLDNNHVAAMPSLHTAAAVMVGRVAWAGPAWVRVLGIGYAVLMLLTLVYFAEHYIVDGIAGAALVLICWRMTAR